MCRAALLLAVLVCSGCSSWSGVVEYARPSQVSALPAPGSEAFIRWAQSSPF